VFTDKKLLADSEKIRADQFREVNAREKIIKRKEDVDREKADIAEKSAKEGISKGKDGKPKDEFTAFIKKNLDLTYVNKIINELKQNSQNYAEREELFDEYKKLTMYCVRNLEGGSRVGKVDKDKKQLITREVNRVFNEKFEKADGFREYIQRMVHYRLEDLNREVKDNKWKIYLSFLTEFLRKNPKNRDLLEKIKFKVYFINLRNSQMI
jgi:hypothetical protein